MVPNDARYFRGDILIVDLKYKATKWSQEGKVYFLVTSVSGVKVSGMPLTTERQYKNIHELKVIVPELQHNTYYAAVTDITTIDKADVIHKISFMNNARYQILIKSVYDFISGNIVYFDGTLNYASKFTGIRFTEEDCSALDRNVVPLKNYVPVEENNTPQPTIDDEPLSEELEQASAEPVVSEDDSWKCSHRYENGKSALELQNNGRAMCIICNRYPNKKNTLGNIPKLDQNVISTHEYKEPSTDVVESIEDYTYYAHRSYTEIMLKYGCTLSVAINRKNTSRNKLGLTTPLTGNKFYIKGATTKELEDLISMTAEEVMEIYELNIVRARRLLKYASDELELRLDESIDMANGLSSNDIDIGNMDVEELKFISGLDIRDIVKTYKLKSIAAACAVKHNAFIRLRMTECPYTFMIEEDVLLGHVTISSRRSNAVVPMAKILEFEKSIYNNWGKIKNLWHGLVNNDILFISTTDDITAIQERFKLDEECSTFLKNVAFKVTSSARRLCIDYTAEEVDFILNRTPLEVMERYLVNVKQYIRLTKLIKNGRNK